MRIFKVLAITLLCTCLLFFTPYTALAAKGRATGVITEKDLPKAGMNMPALAYYDGSFAFSNGMKHAKVWTGTGSVNNWEIEVDERGYPQNVGSDRVTATVLGNEMSHIPQGTWLLEWEGDAEVDIEDFNNAFELVDEGSHYKKYQTVKDGVTRYTNIKVRNGSVSFIGFWLPDPNNPGSSLKDSGLVFNPDFIDYMRPYQVIRFMNWMKGNVSTGTTWESRRTPDHYSQMPMEDLVEGSGTIGVEGQANDGTVNRPKPPDRQRGGVAWEYQIELCNQAQADCWIALPHQATDRFVRKVAEIVRDNLDPDLRAWIEYSNENWNYLFKQKFWLGDHAQDLYLPLSDPNFVDPISGETVDLSGITADHGKRKFNNQGTQISDYEADFGNFDKAVDISSAYRELEIQGIFEEVVGVDRLIRVNSGKNGTKQVAEYTMKLIDEVPNLSGIDVVSRTSYFAGWLINESKGNVLANNNINLSDGYTEEELQQLDDIFWAKANGNFTGTPTPYGKELGVPVVAYEGGSHVTAGKNYYSADQNKVDALAEFHRRDIWEDLYERAMQNWQRAGNYTNVLFDAVSLWGAYGYWGHKQNIYEPDSIAPRYRGLINWVYQPFVDFSMDTSRGSEPLTVNFDRSNSDDAQSPDSDLTFTWDWGDGSTSSDGSEIVSHTFDSGEYTISLNIVDPEGYQYTYSKDIEVFGANNPGERLVSDSFVYDSGSGLHNASDGGSSYGFDGSWKVQNGAINYPGFTIKSGSLEVPGLNSYGNKATGGDAYKGSFRMLDVSDALSNYSTDGNLVNTSSIWSSVKVQETSGSDYQYCLTSSYNDYGGGNCKISVIDQNGNWAIETSEGTHDLGVSASNTARIVMNIDYPSDTLKVWINPGSNLNTGAPDAQETGGNYKFRAVHFKPGNTGNAGFVDGIRFGETYYSVSPGFSP